jgi:hypothetical protein
LQESAPRRPHTPMFVETGLNRSADLILNKVRSNRTYRVIFLDENDSLVLMMTARRLSAIKYRVQSQTGRQLCVALKASDED